MYSTDPYEKYTIEQLDENEIERMMKYISENPLDKYARTDSITLCARYEDIKVCSLQIKTVSEKWTAKPMTNFYITAVLTPDRIIMAKCFSHFPANPERKVKARGLWESTGDEKIDQILDEACCFFHLYEEYNMAFMISRYSDGSEEWEEYGEKYEEMRSKIVEYEFAMREKYNIR